MNYYIEDYYYISYSLILFHCKIRKLKWALQVVLNKICMDESVHEFPLVDIMMLQHEFTEFGQVYPRPCLSMPAPVLATSCARARRSLRLSLETHFLILAFVYWQEMPIFAANHQCCGQ